MGPASVSLSAHQCACRRCKGNVLICFSLRLQVGQNLISLVTTREGVDELLKLDDVIDLVIPRGSNALVSHIQRNTRIAVLGHADGICHIYVDPDSSVDMACRIIVDAKLDYPAACNAVEKVLVHSALARDGRVSPESKGCLLRQGLFCKLMKLDLSGIACLWCMCQVRCLLRAGEAAAQQWCLKWPPGHAGSRASHL